MLALAFAAFVAAGDPAGDAPPPPLLEAPAPEAAPVPTTPALPAPERKKPVADTAPPLGAFSVALLQTLIPCATMAVGVPCAVLAFSACPGGSCFVCMLPAANGYLATYVGDRYGPSRAPAFWPIAVSYATTLVAAGALVFFSVGGAGFTPIGGVNNTGLLLLGGATIAAAVMPAVAVPITYAATSEAKHPDDDGTALPGWFAPGHPPPPKKKPAALKAPAPLAMAF